MAKNDRLNICMRITSGQKEMLRMEAEELDLTLTQYISFLIHERRTLYSLLLELKSLRQDIYRGYSLKKEHKKGYKKIKTTHKQII